MYIYIYVYIQGFPYWEGWKESSPTSQIFAHPPHLEKFPSRLPLPPKVNPSWPH